MSDSQPPDSSSDAEPSTSRETSTTTLPGADAATIATPSGETDADDDSDDDSDRRFSPLQDTIETFRRLVGGSDQTAATPVEDLSTRLKRFISADGITWKRSHTELGDLYSRTYVVTGWPKEAQAHLLYKLYTDPTLVYNTSIHYDPYDHSEAIEHLTDIEEKLENKAEGEFSQFIPNTEAIQQTLGVIREMKVEVENNDRRLYDLSIYVTVFAREKDHLESLHRDLRDRIFTNSGMDFKHPRDYPDEAHLSSSPLGWDPLANNREKATQLVLDKAAGMTFPFVDDTLVEPDGVVVGFNLANETAIVLDIFERNNGYNKLIIGALGSGKSFGEGEYLLRHRLIHPEDNIIIIDPMGGFAGVNEAIGGERITINGNETINPLEISETPEHILEASDVDPYRIKIDEVHWFFRRFFEEYGKPDGLGADMWAPLTRAIRTAYERRGITPDPDTHHRESPTVRDVIDILEEVAEDADQFVQTSAERVHEDWEKCASKLLMALEPFREGGQLDNLVGQTDFAIDDSTPTYIDMQALDGKQNDKSLMMKIVFSMLYEQVKDSSKRTILAIDEAHKIIGEEASADHWEELVRHSRHHDLSIHFISQEFEDFFQSDDGDGANEAAKTIASLCTIRQIHRVNNVNRRLAKDALGLKDSHIDFIESAVPGEAGRGYTTALLDIEDKGYFGLKVTATQNEVAVVDYDPEKSFDGDLAAPESQQIQRALETRGKLTSGPPPVEDDELLHDLVENIPLAKLGSEVTEKLIDRLIADDQTPYTEKDRASLAAQLKGADSQTISTNQAGIVQNEDGDGRRRVDISDSSDTPTTEGSGVPDPPWEQVETGDGTDSESNTDTTTSDSSDEQADEATSD